MDGKRKEEKRKKSKRNATSKKEEKRILQLHVANKEYGLYWIYNTISIITAVCMFVLANYILDI